MTTPSTGWFSIDKEGLAAQLDRRGRSFAVLELLQNALDEPGVSRVEIILRPIPSSRGLATLTVRDDAPGGFADLSHAYTFFAPSTKRSNPEQRGRFNSGEKMVLAICQAADVRTTTGSVTFSADGTRMQSKAGKTQVGSEFVGSIRMTKDDIAETERVVTTCIIPEGITVTFNDEKIEHRQPVLTFEATLDTEVDFKPTRRKTTVSLFEPRPGDPHLYEMGIPVVPHDGRWDINIGQRIPLNTDRDNVTPAFLRKVREVVLEHAIDLITTEDANSTWVKDALPKVTPEVAKQVFVQRFGEKTAVFDPSDHEANKRLQDEGYTIIYGRSLSREEHDALRRAEVFQPSGQIRPSALETSPDGVPPISVEKWTPAMHRLADYAREVSRSLINVEPDVHFYNVPFGRHWGGCWGNRSISFNIGQLGKKWVEDPKQESVDALLIHELAHGMGASDHFSDAFIRNCCDLGSRLRSLPYRLARSS